MDTERATLRAVVWQKEMRPAWLVMLLSILATLVVWSMALRYDRRAMEAEFGAIAGQFIGDVEMTIQAYEQILRAGVGMFATHADVTQDDWHAFVSALELPVRQPGIQGVGYVAMIRPEELSPHISRYRIVHGSSYKVHPVGSRALYSAIVYLEPLDWRNRRAIGYDMFAEPVRRAAMEAARDSGKTVATGKVRLVQETSTEVQAGVLLYCPIYLTSAESNARPRLTGFIYAPIRMGDFMKGIISGRTGLMSRFMRIEAYDGQPSDPDALLYDSGPWPQRRHNPRFSAAHSVSQNGRIWSFRFSSRPEFEQRASVTPNLVLLGGVMLSGVLTSMVSLQVLRNIQEARSRVHMEILTRELSHRVKNTLAIVQSIANRSLAEGRTIADGKAVFTRRLHALAHAQSLLINSGWTGACLRELVAIELASFGARAEIAGPDLKLRPQVAQSFALLAHELASNAARFGSLSNRDGQLSVTWRPIGAGRDGSFEFIWSESGGPAVVPPVLESFGMSLLRQPITHSVSTEPTIEFRPEGFYYRTEIPVHALENEALHAGRSA